jgi:hypothetical protein
MPPDDTSPPADPKAAAPARPDPQPHSIVGYIDRIEGRRITGWAWDRSHPDVAIDIEIRVDGRVAVSAKADRFRKDLADGKVGNGAHAFDVEIDKPIGAEGFGRVTAFGRCGRSDPVALVNRTIDPSQAAAAAGPPPELRRWLEDLAVVQRSFEDTLKGAARDIRASLGTRDMSGGDAAKAAKLGEELRAEQEALARQIAALEVFHARFDKILQSAERPAAGPEFAAADDRGLKLAVAAAAGMSAISLLIGLWAILH